MGNVMKESGCKKMLTLAYLVHIKWNSRKNIRLHLLKFLL